MSLYVLLILLNPLDLLCKVFVQASTVIGLLQLDVDNILHLLVLIVFQIFEGPLLRPTLLNHL